MKHHINWPEVYSALVTGGTKVQKTAVCAARRIERDIAGEGWAAGAIFANHAELEERYCLGRDTIREAVRLLEDRGVARMRRGPNGGLMVLRVPHSLVTVAVCDHLHVAGLTRRHIRDVHAVLTIMARYALGSARHETVPFSSLSKTLANGCPQQSVRHGSVLYRSSKDAVVRLFGECLEAFEAALPLAEPVTPDQAADSDLPMHAPLLPHDRGDHETLGEPRQSLAMQVIRMLVSDLQLGVWMDDVRVGTEDELCQRYGVSKQVLRQAIRVLENHGLIESQRGRSHGVVVTKPSPAAVIEQVVAYFSSLSLGEDDISASKYMLTRVINALAAAKSTPQQNKLLMQYIEAVTDWHEPRNLIGLIQLTVQIVDNPFLGLMFQSLHSYVARLGDNQSSFFEGQGKLIWQNLRERQRAVIAGDLCRADQIFEEIYGGSGQLFQHH